MADPRVEKLARVLVHYSLSLFEGDLFKIGASPLVREVYREALLAGAHPYVVLTYGEALELLIKNGTEAQLCYLSPVARQEAEEIDAQLRIMASENTKCLSGADPQKIALLQQAGQELTRRFLARATAGELRWCGTLFPTHAAAQDAEMSFSDYEDFVYAAGKLHYDDPFAAWKTLRAEQQCIVGFLATKKVIRLIAPDTDLTCHVAGRTWINCAGDKNFPDGEVFTGPEEAKTEGFIRFTFPAVYSSREVEDVQLVFQEGKVVRATATKGEELLHALLDMDEGARRLGEIAFGTNYDIRRFSRNTLFDEKIGGTVHLALGAAYPETGGRNHSALHWDMVCDMRQRGEVYADGELIYKDGKFII